MASLLRRAGSAARHASSALQSGLAHQQGSSASATNSTLSSSSSSSSSPSSASALGSGSAGGFSSDFPAPPVAVAPMLAPMPSQSQLDDEDDTAQQAALKASLANKPVVDLILAIEDAKSPSAQIVSALFDLLVVGEFHLHSNYEIRAIDALYVLLDVAPHCSVNVQAEIWNTLIAILEKSITNLELCSRWGLIEKLLGRIHVFKDDIALTKVLQLVEVLGRYCISVRELRSILRTLKSSDQKLRPRFSVKLMNVLRSMAQEERPNVYFHFSGNQSGIMLPCVTKWPYQTGFTFSTWFRIEPPDPELLKQRLEKPKPYLYCFKTDKGLGYSGHFDGKKLTISFKLSMGKITSDCDVPFDFEPRQWYMFTAVHNYRRIGSSELMCYVNGQLVLKCDIKFVTTTDLFTHCFLGTSTTPSVRTSFCGQIGATYVFNDALSSAQVAAIHALKSDYMSNFRQATESSVPLTTVHRKTLFDGGRLTSAIMFTYNPKAVSGNVCFECSPNDANQWFSAESSGAILLNGSRTVVTHSYHHALESIGGIQTLFPLVSQFDHADQPRDGALGIVYEPDPAYSLTLLSLFAETLAASTTSQSQLDQHRGFTVLAHLLDDVLPTNMSRQVLEVLLQLAQSLRKAAETNSLAAQSLFRDLFDQVLFRFNLWICSDVAVQKRLLGVLASDLVRTESVNVRSLIGVQRLMDLISNFFWLPDPATAAAAAAISATTEPPASRAEPAPDNEDETQSPTGAARYQLAGQPVLHPVTKRAVAQRPNTSDIVELRMIVLTIIKQLVLDGSGITADELSAILNYIVANLSINQEWHVIDAVELILTLMCDHPEPILGLFEQQNGIQVALSLLSAKSVPVRGFGLKILGKLLSWLPTKRADKLIQQHQLFSLISTTLSMYSTELDKTTYNALFEIMLNQVTKQLVPDRFVSRDATSRIAHPGVLRTLFDLVTHDSSSAGTTTLFRLLGDLVMLLSHEPDNRRIFLAFPNWQNWFVTFLKSVTRVQDCGFSAHHLVNPAAAHSSVLVVSGNRQSAAPASARPASPTPPPADPSSSSDASLPPTPTPPGAAAAAQSFSGSAAPAAIVASAAQENLQCAELICTLFRVLLCHALKNEREGYQVWVDTIAVFKHEDLSNSVLTFPELHFRFICDVLLAVEADMQAWRTNDKKSGADFVNMRENSLFVFNVAFFVSIVAENVLTLKDAYAALLTVCSKPTSASPSAANANLSGQTAPGLAPPASERSERSERSSGMSAAGAIVGAIGGALGGAWSTLGAVAANTASGGSSNTVPGVTSVTGTSLFSRNRPSNLFETAPNSAEDNSEEPSFYDSRAMLMVNMASESGATAGLIAGAEPTDPTTEDADEQDLDASDKTSATIESASSRPVLDVQPLVTRLIHLVDLLVFASTISYDQLETRRGMSIGGILRQCLRLVCCRIQTQLTASISTQTAGDATPAAMTNRYLELDAHLLRLSELRRQLVEVMMGHESERFHRLQHYLMIRLKEQESKIDNLRCVLDRMDVKRLRAIVYRDMDGHLRQAQQLLLAELQFLSVIIVSEYKSILDPSNSDPNVPDDDGSLMTSRIEAAFSSVTPLIHESCTDFKPFLSKAFVTPSGTELITKESPCLRAAASVIEVVMALTSSDWQRCLRDVAEQAYRDMVLEGQHLAARYERELRLRSSNAQLAIQAAASIELEAQSSSMFAINKFLGMTFADEANRLVAAQAALRRGTTTASRVYAKVFDLLTNENGPWGLPADSAEQKPITFMKLDSTEDALRRRARLVPNRYGSDHQEAILLIESTNNDADNAGAVSPGVEPITVGGAMAAMRAATKLKLALKAKTATAAHDDDMPFDDDSMNDSMNELPAASSSSAAAASPASSSSTPASSHGTANGAAGSASATATSAPPAATPALPQLGGADPLASTAGKRVLLSAPCEMITPGGKIPGTFKIVTGMFSFTADEDSAAFKELQQNPYRVYLDVVHGQWTFDEVTIVYPRRYMLRHSAIEVFLSNHTTLMVNFADRRVARRALRALPNLASGTEATLGSNFREAARGGLAAMMTTGATGAGAGAGAGANATNAGAVSGGGLSNGSSASSMWARIFLRSDATARWQRREISNFEYLMLLNTMAGRSFNDLNQYPVFPWVLTDYESENLDLKDPSVFRDLSKPIGALNPTRLETFVERFESWEDEEVPAFHYGSHYSAAGYVLFWLIRLEPFSTLFLNLQGGHFDHAGRTFASVGQAWRNCMDSTTDVKELIPELYSLPEMLVNANKYPFGKDDDGATVDNVTLPPWAHGSSEEFVRLHREALESDYVSEHLHEWIDLIFGYKQRGPEAEKAVNVFYYLTYDGAVDIDAISDPVMRQAVEQQIASFGQTPCKLLNTPHPRRGDLDAAAAAQAAGSNATAGAAKAVTPSESTSHWNAESLHSPLLKLPITSDDPVCFVTGNVNLKSIVTVSTSRMFGSHTWTYNAPATMEEGDLAFDLMLDPVLEEQTSGEPVAHSSIVRRLPEPLDQRIAVSSRCFATSADNSVLVTCGYWDNSFKCYALDSGKLLQSVHSHRDVVTCMAMSADGTLLVTGSRDSTVRVWPWSTKKQRCADQPSSTLFGHEHMVSCIAVSTSFDLVASGSRDVVLLHTIGGDFLRSLRHPCFRRVVLVCISPKNGSVTVAYSDKGGALALFSMNGKLLATEDLDETVNAMCHDKNGDFLFTGGARSCLMVKHAFSLKHVHIYASNHSPLCSIALTSDERYVLSGLESGLLVVNSVDFSTWRRDAFEPHSALIPQEQASVLQDLQERDVKRKKLQHDQLFVQQQKLLARPNSVAEVRAAL
ncbi:neutral sphingomyelinase activation associated factor [Capsaspora owczarzaki ATCC 30864]|uniref:Neutral sphingomyelinase activation associated factor n=1 Tax=Capsaspora owczarzaki (strain ATCC 30864) TaxID=595528 RepID=A0A0D2X4J9_CAPO3|nr:neutral sphingomyelinase activation associated factor [Capsaspora owczarzaki ATCC 30864]KJE96189.1 neutral sphingomyelinase activation associated factor [Capsaspora owczarzaki ATCC 30864]|eukprot:XP_004345297.1 neutral sphingomyelinase activation associated factor [Capsaspora owczarzaki ATCC 30864]